MGFDYQNFGLGVLAGWATAYGVYRARRSIGAAITAVRRGAQVAQTSATARADVRYVNDLEALAEAGHLAGDALPLSSILVEPRFVAQEHFAMPLDDDAGVDIFRVIPFAHDHPFLYGAYNIPTFGIDELGTGSRALALLGKPGSGRTTAMMATLLYSLSKLNFKPPVDQIQAKLDSEEAALSEKERAVRVKERVTMEMRARERMASERGQVFNADAEAKNTVVPPVRQLTPLYAHLANITAFARELGSDIDPAEPLVRAVQSTLGRVTASTIPRPLYQTLARGQALVLIDGLDDLPLEEQTTALAWLRAFQAQYSSNFVIVTGPATGYGALTRLGFTPIFMRPWNDLDCNQAVEKWSLAWSAFSARRKRAASQVEASLVERAKINNRALLPLEVTFKIWATFTGDVEIAGYEGWRRVGIARLLASNQPLATLLPNLATMAALQLDEGWITAKRLKALAVDDSNLTEASISTSALNDATTPPAEEPSPAKADSETAAQDKLLARLERTRLIDQWRADRFAFRHPLIAAYLASLTLQNASDETLLARARTPAWAQAVGYASLHTTLDAVVRQRLTSAADSLYNQAFDVARWLVFAPLDTNWRGDVLRLLGNMLIAPNLYPMLRDRAACALLDTREKSVLLIFRRAIRNANPDVRRLACLGLGAIGDPEGIKDLRPLLDDQVPEVQLAAGLALGAIGTEEALEAMVMALTQGSEPLRQAIAEALAAMPQDGYPILYEAVSDEDMMLRRAAIFGLRRLRTTWALVSIYRAFLEDEQWYVRSAAQLAFQELTYGREVSLTEPYPAPSQIAWLAEWAASIGETVPTGEAGHQMLLRALQEGEPSVRALAARAIGQLGSFSNMKALYLATRDRQEEVRAAAHAGLSALQARLGVGLPLPI